MFELLMLIGFAYAGFCYLLPEVEKRGTGAGEENRGDGTGKAERTGGRLSPRGRGRLRRNEAGQKRPLLSRAG